MYANPEDRFSPDKAPFILNISLIGISDFSIKISEFLSLFNHSPNLKKSISLFGIPNVSCA